MKRSGLSSNPAKTAAWRERSKPLTRQPMKHRPPKRNDSAWRAEVLAARGRYCRACGDTHDLQADHVKERSQGGLSVVPNGMVLCGPWSRTVPGGCHAAKTEGRLLIRPEWLDPDQIDWLAGEGWVFWDDAGVARGRGCRGFADRRRAR